MRLFLNSLGLYLWAFYEELGFWMDVCPVELQKPFHKDLEPLTGSVPLPAPTGSLPLRSHAATAVNRTTGSLRASELPLGSISFNPQDWTGDM